MTTYNPESYFTDTNDFEVTLDSFEGPLSLLLDLAQEHRIDLNLLSLKVLSEQYINFVASTPTLEKRADYLRMASYLIWLKSKTLLPQPETEEDTLTTEQEELALLSRLNHLRFIRVAAEKIVSLRQVGTDCWNYEGNTLENTSESENIQYPDMTLLLKSYGNVLSRNVKMPLKIISTKIFNARELLSDIRIKLRNREDWLPLFSLLPQIQQEDHGLHLRSGFSATFLVALILLHQGEADIKQSSNFSPLYIIAKDKRYE